MGGKGGLLGKILGGLGGKTGGMLGAGGKVITPLLANLGKVALVAGKAAGALGLLAVAGYAGYQAGTWLYNKMDSTETGQAVNDKIGAGLAHIMALFGNKDAKDAIATNRNPVEPLNKPSLTGTPAFDTIFKSMEPVMTGAATGMGNSATQMQNAADMYINAGLAFQKAANTPFQVNVNVNTNSNFLTATAETQTIQNRRN